MREGPDVRAVSDENLLHRRFEVLKQSRWTDGTTPRETVVYLGLTN
jgi:hypothetical protein